MTTGVEQVSAMPDPEALAATALQDWEPRPWVLAALLALGGLLLHFLWDGTDPAPIEGAGAAFLFFGSLSAAFALERDRWQQAAIFAVGVGAVMAGLAWHVLRYDQVYAAREFAFAAGVFASVIALPLFQAQFHRTRLATDYKLTHFHVWTDAISGAGALAFTGLSWLMLLLLDQLLGLVGIDVIEQLWREEWFAWMWCGGAFGTALGVLRNNLKIIGSLQNVVLIVLSLLAVPLALALVVFLVALLASGGQALWQATDAATPVLLACAVGCFVLTNAIMRDDDAATSRSRILRAVAMVLAAGVLPLALFAAVSLGIRLDQHGLSPERIWALIAVAVAVAYGLAYAVGLALGRRRGWAGKLRQANLNLAAGTCVLALILALPLWDFGALSARSQLARLEAGRVSVEEFDYTALRWDFGDAGRRALARLAGGEGKIAELAAAAQAQTERIYDWNRAQVGTGFAGTLRLEPDDPALRTRVEAFLDYEPWRCADYCVVLDLGEQENGARRVALVQRFGYELVDLPERAEGAAATEQASDAPAAPSVPAGPLTDDTVVELREETTRSIYVDGRRVGSPVEVQAESVVGNVRYIAE